MGDGAAYSDLGRMMAEMHLSAIYKSEYEAALGWSISTMLDHDKITVVQIVSTLPICSTEWEPEKRIKATCRLLLARLLPRLEVMMGEEYVLDGLTRLLNRERAAKIIREVNQVL